MQIRFRCPSCRQKYAVESKHSGSRMRCAKCRTRIEVPTVVKKRELARVASAVESHSTASFADDDELDLSRRRADSTEEMDLTPMVDVTFLLLIFFMITASFSIQKSLAVPPPEPKDKGVSREITLPDLEESSILVEIDARNLVTVEEQVVSDLKSLPKVLKAARKSEILVVAHHDSLHEVVVRVIDASNEIGLQKIRVAMKEKS